MNQIRNGEGGETISMIDPLKAIEGKEQ